MGNIFNRRKRLSVEQAMARLDRNHAMAERHVREERKQLQLTGLTDKARSKMMAKKVEAPKVTKAQLVEAIRCFLAGAGTTNETAIEEYQEINICPHCHHADLDTSTIDWTDYSEMDAAFNNALSIINGDK